MEREIGKIGNQYGGLSICSDDGKCYWAIEDWDGNKWVEIPKYLHDAINRHQDEIEEQDGECEL